jgi:hypothetical protein
MNDHATPQRASIFEDDQDLDLSSFKPKAPATTKPDKKALRDVAEARGFSSREPVTPAVPTAPPVATEPMLQRRYRTGRNRQINLKVTDDVLRRFYALADAQELILAEVLEHAVTALEEKIARGEGLGRSRK